ncbi:MAG TPA: murein biosynthesis integral membrane protein MurJ [Candidatus Limnocylindrales bacterium]|nr:murein biosynthesis integral membrane protein MurJ [Candidatus Limnocylindrales bacterium]
MTDMAALDDGMDETPAEPERTSARSLAKAGLVVSSAYLVSRVLGYLRVLLVTTTFGAGHELDAFNAAFRIPDLIYQLVAAGAVASALVPMVGGLLATGEDQRAWRVVSTIANLMLVALAALAAVAFITAPWLVPTFIAPGFPPDVLAKTIDLTRLMLLAPILLALGAVATSALNAERRFAATAVAPIVYNLAIIGGALFLSSTMGVTGLAIGVVAGSFGHLAIQVPSLRKAGFRYAPKIDLGDDAARRALILMVPRVFGLGASQITIVVMVALASSFGSGAVTDWTNAFTLLQIPLGVIGIPLGIVLLPSLSREVAVGRTDVYLALIARSMRILLFVMLPIAAIGMAISLQVVDLLLGYGKVDAEAVLLTASTLQLFLLGLGAHASIGVLARAFYARHDTRTPVLAAILAVVINTSLAWILVGPIGLPALGLAIAIAAWAEAIVLLVILKRREPGLDLAGIGSVAVRSLIAAAIAAGVAVLVVRLLPGEPSKVLLLLQAGSASIVAGLAYVGIAFALRIKELPTMISIVTDLVRRRR